METSGSTIEISVPLIKITVKQTGFGSDNFVATLTKADKFSKFKATPHDPAMQLEEKRLTVVFSFNRCGFYGFHFYQRHLRKQTLLVLGSKKPS